MIVIVSKELNAILWDSLRGTSKLVSKGRLTDDYEPVIKSGCLWDNYAIDGIVAPMGLSCSCPKCSAWS